jgi:hypothetical protein
LIAAALSVAIASANVFAIVIVGVCAAAALIAGARRMRARKNGSSRPLRHTGE